MTLVQIIDNVVGWLEREVCSQITLKLPDDFPGGFLLRARGKRKTARRRRVRNGAGDLLFHFPSRAFGNGDRPVFKLIPRDKYARSKETVFHFRSRRRG